MKLGVSVEESDETRKVTISSNPRQRNWIDLPLDQDCLLQVELKQRTLDRAKVSETSIWDGSLYAKFDGYGTLILLKLSVLKHYS